MIHSLETILDSYSKELGRVKMPTIVQLEKMAKENNINVNQLLCFRIASEEWVVVTKNEELKPYKETSILK